MEKNPKKNAVRLLCLSRVYRMDVLHPLNQTPLGFPFAPDDIRARLKGLGFGSLYV